MDTLIPNGRPVPTFTLPDLQGDLHGLEELRGRVAVLNFWSAECPWSERADRELLAYRVRWGERVAWWNIASNVNEPVEMLAQVAAERGLPGVLLDADQQTANRYGAQTTPHLFVLDAAGILRYQGAFDDVTFRQRTPSRFYLREAVESLLAGRTPEPDQTPAYGCTVVRHNPT